MGNPKRAAPDIDAILTRIEAGESQSEIAASLRVNVSTVSRWLDRDEDTVQRSARAMAMSAEAWLDRGLGVLERAVGGEVDSAAARAYEQACARRAAIRNPKYRDKQDHTLSAPDGGPVKLDVSTRPQLTKEEWLAAHGVVSGT